MLLADFYQLNQFSAKPIDGKTKVEAEITLNASNAIFKGHFPNFPVVPGVCLIQVVKEMAERALEMDLLLTAASTIKFLAVLNPENQPNVNIKIDMRKKENDVFELDGKIDFGEIIFFKMKADFIVQ